MQISIGLPERASETGVLNHVKIYPLGVIFTYSGGIFNYAVVHFSTALMCKQKTGSKFYVRKLARGKQDKKVRESLV